MIINLTLNRNKTGVNAFAKYNTETKKMIVLKGSVLSNTIAYSDKFRGAKTIEKCRQGVWDGTSLAHDVEFKSASTAANFVTGASTNGLIAWKDEQGKTLKSVLDSIGGKHE